MFLYWGRRGAMTPFTLTLGRTALRDETMEPVISVSRQNERFGDFAEFGERLHAVDTFRHGSGALLAGWRVPGIGKGLLARLRRDKIETVYVLMSHVWTPLVAPSIRKAGLGYIPIVHDAVHHPGDPTSAVLGWQLRDADHATSIVTLSASVAASLAERRPSTRGRIVTLFHPDLEPAQHAAPAPAGKRPFRLLFLGRILPYKGLSLLVDAVERLTREGVPIQLGVYGEGDLENQQERLQRLGATVVNRWLDEAEIAEALATHDAMALSHVEASQSGVAALALGAGLPVIATPVGGLVEQVTDGETGVLAVRADANAVADAIRRLALDLGLRRAIRRSIAKTRESRSMSRFLRELRQIARR